MRRGLVLSVRMRRNTDMKKLSLVAASLIACAFLQSCGTTNTVRWAYGEPSVFEAPSKHSESTGLRAIVGIPVIVSGVLFDAVTFPAQAVFGVWPWWGASSQMMKPSSM